MTVLISVLTPQGTVRNCNARCHNADPSFPSGCVCGGYFRGIGADRALAVKPAELAEVREQLKLAEGETLQLRLGA